MLASIIFGLFFTVVQAKLQVIPQGDLGACDENQPRIIDESGVDFYSPNYPENYPPASNCSWLLITDEESEVIEVAFQDFALGACVLCLNCDYMEAYDGDSVEDPFLGRVCGNSLPELFRSTGQSMLLTFISGGASSFGGFHAIVRHYEIPPPACTGSEPQVLTDINGTVASPGYPYFYEPDLNCRWLILPDFPPDYIRVTFEKISLENCCECDYIDLIPGRTTAELRMGRWWGNDAPYIAITKGPALLVHFVSDSAVQLEGFKLAYEAVYE